MLPTIFDLDCGDAFADSFSLNNTNTSNNNKAGSSGESSNGAASGTTQVRSTLRCVSVDCTVLFTSASASQLEWISYLLSFSHSNHSIVGGIKGAHRPQGIGRCTLHVAPFLAAQSENGSRADPAFQAWDTYQVRTPYLFLCGLYFFVQFVSIKFCLQFAHFHYVIY